VFCYTIPNRASLYAATVLPSRTTLSERLLDEEIVRVKNEINKDLEYAEHLILSMVYLN